MSTVDKLIERVRRDAGLASRGPYLTLSGSHNNTVTTLTFNEDFTHIGAGETLSVDYEMMYVLDTMPTTKQVTVIRGAFASTAATHDDKAIVEVAARFPKAALLDWAKAEIEAWGPRLWRITGVDIPVSITNNVYDLAGVTGNILFLLDTRLKPIGTDLTWWNWSWVNNRWQHWETRLLRQMSTTEFPSGNAIQFVRPIRKSTTARVAIAQPFNLGTFTPTTDLIATVGLREEWEQIVEAGVKWRALTSTAIGRSDWRTNNVARVAEEVTVNDTINMQASLRAQRQLWLSDAMTDLRSEFPFRKN